MKKMAITTLFLFIFLFLGGCVSQGIRGVNFTMKHNGDERTFALGNGWKYSHTITITNGLPKSIIEIIARRGLQLERVAELKGGEIYSETLESSMCYGYKRNYSYWEQNPPETTFFINRYEVVGEKDGNGLKEFVGTKQIIVEMFSCDKARNQITGIIVNPNGYIINPTYY